MRSLKFSSTSSRSLSVLASSLLMLTACTSVPIKPPLVLPPIHQVAREKPVSAMQEIQPPPPPVAISKLPQARQAEAATLLYTVAAGVAGQCLKSRDVLIQWIRGE